MPIPSIIFLMPSTISGCAGCAGSAILLFGTGTCLQCISMKAHLEALKHYERYAACTLDVGLEYRKLRSGEEFFISGASDSDWKGCPYSGRSHGGHFVLCNNQIVIWSSKTMTSSVKGSSTEAEFIQMSLCGHDCTFAAKMFDQWWFQPRSPQHVTIDYDNAGAGTIARGEASGKSRSF